MVRGNDLIFYLEDKNNHCNWAWAILLDRKSSEEQAWGGKSNFSNIFLYISPIH